MNRADNLNRGRLAGSPTAANNGNGIAGAETEATAAPVHTEDLLSKPVLVLNRIWQAVNVVSVRRCLGLLYLGRALVVADDYALTNGVPGCSSRR